MKKTRLTALILTFVLLFGCLSVLPVFAEEAENAQVDIVAQNIVYSDTIRIAYALDCSVEDAQAGNVKLAYTVDGETKLATLWKNGEELYEGKPIFVTRGFHANHFTDVVTAVAYTGDAAPAGATEKTYSVAEYLFAMLYKHDFINKTELDVGDDGLDYERRELYLSLMTYGTQAQKILDKAEDNALLDNYCYLWTTEQSVTINGSNSALVAPGTAVTLAGAPSFVLCDPDGITTEDATANYVAEAGMVAKVTVDLGMIPVVGTFDDDGLTIPETAYISNYIAPISGGTTQPTTAIDYATQPSDGSLTTITLGTDPTDAGNKVLQVVKAKGKGNAFTYIKPSNESQEGNCVVFETKIYVGPWQYDRFYINFYYNNADATDSKVGMSLYFNQQVAGGQFQMRENNANGTGANANGGNDMFINSGLTYESLPVEKWFGLRIEYYRGETQSTQYTKVWVDFADGNGYTLVVDGNYSNAYSTYMNFSHVAINHDDERANTNYFDDMSVVLINKEYVAGN